MVDIQSAAAEIRRGKKKKKKQTTGQKYNGRPITQGSLNNRRFALFSMLPVKERKCDGTK